MILLNKSETIIIFLHLHNRLLFQHRRGYFFGCHLEWSGTAEVRMAGPRCLQMAKEMTRRC